MKGLSAISIPVLILVRKPVENHGFSHPHRVGTGFLERRWGEMKRMKVLFLFLFVVLIPVFSSCHPRHVSDIKPNMTKEDVVSVWGGTNLITYKTVNEKTIETWEYHFSNSGSICWVSFSQDRVVSTECRNTPRSGYYYAPPYYPYPSPYYYPYYPYRRYWR